MRVALVVHGLPPHERTGVETHVAALASELGRRGLDVQVFAPRRDPRSPEFAQRREQREGHAVTWIVLNQGAQSAEEHLERAGVASAFGEFLDRERPALVHFHHLRKLGVGLIAEARRRGLPTLYTAHDFYPICHRTILARPDLARCATLGDAHACAQCDRAASWLDAKGRWSDYQAGVLPDMLSEAEREELRAVLDPATDVPGFDVVRDERARLERRRRQAFASLDLILAPTEFVRERMIAAGLDGARIERSDYGLDARALARLEPPRARDGEPLTFGYLGGAHKHKGPHVLLEAYGLLRLPARLDLRADSSDREYVRALQRRAGEVGARWQGAFAPEDLPGILAGIDVVVVPSIWWENAPFVIREAFAAHRPVIASDLPALRESVREGVDGWLVPPEDPRALADAMERLASAPEQVRAAARRTRAPRALEDLAGELVERYERLAGRARRVVAAEVPASVRPFAERILALEPATLGELAARARAGLAGLARSLGVEPRALAPVDAEGLLLERLADARREIAWRTEREASFVGGLELERAKDAASLERLAASLAQSVRDGEAAREALAAAERELRARAAQFEQLAATHAAAGAALAAEREAHDRARAALAEASAALQASALEREALGRGRSELVRARDLAEARLVELAREKLALERLAASTEAALPPLRRRADLAEERAGFLDESLTSERARFAELARELAEQRERQAELERELVPLRARHAELVRAAAALEHGQGEWAQRFDALERHARWLERESAALARALGHEAAALREPEDFAAARAAWARLDRELAWRRAEMRALQAEGGRVVRALVERSALGRRLRGWGSGA